MLRILWNDVRYAVRGLAAARSFSAIAIVTLALGIGASAAVYSVVHAVLLRQLPYQQPERLYTVWIFIPQIADKAPSLPVPAFDVLEWRKRTSSFSSMAAIAPSTVIVSAETITDRVGGARVSANFFDVLGVRPQLGRTFATEEDVPGRNQVVLISHGFWQERFGGGDVLGKTMLVDGERHQIVGVLPREFQFASGKQLHPLMAFADRTDIWKPMAFTASEIAARGNYNNIVIGRLKDGVLPAAAQEETGGIAYSLLKRDMPDATVTIRALMVPLQESLVGKVRPGLLAMLGAVLLLLVLVSINLATLLFARVIRRQRELATKVALGARPAAIVRDVLMEGMLLATAGGLLGLMAVSWGRNLLIAFAPADLPRLQEVTISPAIVIFAACCAIVAVLASGAIPAFHASRANLASNLKESGRTSAGSRTQRRLLSGLMALQVCMTLVLLVGAALLLRSFVKLMNVDRGFAAEQVVTAVSSLPGDAYPEARRKAYYDAALDRLRAMPDVRAAAVISRVPLAAEVDSYAIQAEGAAVPTVAASQVAVFRTITPEYFGAMDISVVAGRKFADALDQQPSAIVSLSVARTLWPEQVRVEDAIGRRFRRGGASAPWLTVVGVVADVRSGGLDQKPSSSVYIPFWQDLRREMTFVVRTGQGAGSTLRDIRTSIATSPCPPSSGCRSSSSPRWRSASFRCGW